MESEYNTHLNSKLVTFEKSSKEWEWSDLIKWLSGLKQLIEKFEKIRVPADQIHTLSKRLGQCLFPSLPHGLHSKTLEIYSCLLSKASFPHIILLSTGLFPHFQYCAPQNKPQFLDLISENYIPRLLEFNLVLQGLFACLLAGANDTPDTFAKVCEILDICAGISKSATHQVLWWFILKSNRHRVAGLMYMQKRLDRSIEKRLIVNALLESLADPNVMIRRSALDLIRNYFPLGVRHKRVIVTLMQGALRLLRSKDHTILRRIWEWAFPEEFDEVQIKVVSEILQPAVRYIFEENHLEIVAKNEIDEAKLLSIKIAETLSENDSIGEMILSRIAIVIVKYTVLDELYVIRGKPDLRIKQIFSDKKSRIFWKTYESQMSELLQENEDEALIILKFAIENFEFSYDSFPTLFKNLFSQIPVLQNLNLALDILISLLTSTDIDDLDVDNAIDFYKSLFSDPNTKILSKFTELFGILMSKGIQVRQVKKTINKYIKKHFLRGVSLMLNLRTEISSEILVKLWNLVSTESHTKVCELITEACSVSKEEWNQSTISLLMNSDISIQETYMRKFISFWQYMEKNRTEQLTLIVRSTRIVYIMIDQLDSENPITKHLAKEWLCAAQPTPPHILDPILKIMLNKATARDLNSDGFYYYLNPFDYKRVEDSIFKALLITENGGKSVLTQFRNSELSIYCAQKCTRHSLQADSYLSLLIKLMLLFVQTRVPWENIQSKAADLLSLLVKDLPTELIPTTLNSCAEVVYKVLHTNSKVETYVLNVLESLLSNKITVVYQSKFADSLILGLRNQKRKLRLTWMRIISFALPFILNSITVPDLTNYLHSLFVGYYDIIVNLDDFSSLPGLIRLVHFALDINNKTQTCLIHSEVKEMIKNQIDKILHICLKFYENEKNISRFQINSLIVPMASMFQAEFIEGLLELWKLSILSKPKTYLLSTIILMTPLFNISPETIFETSLVLIEKTSKEDPNHIITASFLQNVLLVLENFKIPLSGAALWNRVIALLRYLSLSPHKEMVVFQINMIYILSTRISIDQRALRDLQDVLKALSLQCAETLKWCAQAADVCYLSTEFCTESVSKKVLRALIERGSFIFDIILGKDQEKRKVECIVAMLNNLLMDLPTNINEGELLGELIESYIKSSPDKVAEGLKSGLLEFYKNSLFSVLEQHPSSLRSWGNVISWIAHKYYIQKAALLTDLMYHFEPSFWYRTETVQNLLYKSSALMCFVIFSSAKGTYSSAVGGILHKVNDLLNIEEIKVMHFKILCLLLKILYLRLPRMIFNEIWVVARGYLHVLFLTYLKGDDLYGIFEVVKFLDFMLATGFDDLKLLYCYLFDVPEIELTSEKTEDFNPAVSNSFLAGFSARPCRAVRNAMFVSAYTKRKLIFSGPAPETMEDLDRLVKTLIQFCTFYSSEIIETDWNSVEAEIEIDISKLNQFK